MISVESKLFSIYATGVVAGKGRETRVRIHAVVDFRNANDFTQLPGEDEEGGAATPGGNSNSSSSDADPNAAANTLQANPAGNIIHFKIR